MMKPFAYLLLGLAALATSLPLAAQNRTDIPVDQEVRNIEKKTLVGTILDEDGQPLPGASVRIEDTDAGTITDTDGNFSLIVEGRRPVLVVTYIGMKTARIALTPEAKYVRITLEEDATLMDEVIVTGYQNIKRENATGAFQSLSSKDMEKSP